MSEENYEKLKTASLNGEARDVELVKKLVSDGSVCSDTALYFAVEMAVNNDAKINNTLDKGAITATENRSKELVEFILDYGADVNAKVGYNCFGYSTLAYACRYASFDIVKMLEAKYNYMDEADFEIEDKFGRNPIQLAFRSGNQDKIDLFLDQSKWSTKGSVYKKRLEDSFGDDYINRFTLLNYATASNIVQEETLMKLIQLGADVNGMTGDGFTVLKMAILAENFEIVKLLLKNGATVNGDIGRDEKSDGRSELGVAVSTGQIHIAKYLLELGADVHRG